MKPNTNLYQATKSNIQDNSLAYQLWEVLDPDGRPCAWGCKEFCERFSKSLNEGPVVLPN